MQKIETFEKDFATRKRIPSVYFVVGPEYYTIEKVYSTLAPLASTIKFIDCSKVKDLLPELEPDLLQTSRLFRVALKDPNFKDPQVDFLKNLPEGTMVMFLVNSLGQKVQESFKFAKIVSAATPFPKDVQTWFDDLIKGEFIKMSNSAKELLLTRLYYDRYLINRDMQKFRLLGLKEISIDYVEDLVPDYSPEKFYNLLELGLRGDRQSIAKVFSSIEGEPGIEYKILTFLSNFWSQAMVIVSLRNKALKEVASLTGLNPYRVKKTMDLISGYSLRRIRDMSGLVLIMDSRIRQRKVDPIVYLESYFLKLT